jgi:hypothetical protein
MILSRFNQKWEVMAGACFAGAFLAFIFFYAILPIYDPDFWWHLKTGEVMFQNRGVLSADPFTFTGDGVITIREALILKGYWLWQLTAYGLYALLGFNGIFLLNLLTVCAMAGVVAQQLRRQEVGHALAAVLLTLGFYLLSAYYPLERPQVVSFLLATILLGLLARVRDGGSLGWPLPLVMIVWANLHGGFVVGDLILLCFAAGAVMEYRHDLPRLRHLLLWVVLGISASLLNPNGALVFAELFSFNNSTLMTEISEYQSTLVKFQQGSWYVAILWLLIALYGLGIWSSRRLYWPDLLVALFLAYFSVKYARNIAFFAVAMLPATGFYLHEGARRRQWSLPPFFSLLLVSLCTLFLLGSAYSLGQGRGESGPVKAIYPEKAIAFLHESNLQGRMFNSYEYGGYLLWRLAPQIKVFIDGRGVQPQVFADWQKISSASTAWVDGRREYEGLLDRYAIDYIIQPIYDGAGMVQPLMKELLNKPEWVPIYLDTTVYILARLTPLNAETISTYRIDKNEFKNRLLLIVNYICQSYPQEIGYQVARAGMLLYLSMYEEAKAQVEAIMAIAPNNQFLPELQHDLEFLRAQRLRQ